MNIPQQLQIVNYFTLAGSLASFYFIFQGNIRCVSKKGNAAILLFSMASFCLSKYILQRKPNKSYTWRAVFLQLFMDIFYGIFAKSCYIKYFANASKYSVEEPQKKILMNILNDIKNTRYGKDMKLANIKSVEEFRQQIPLNNYESLLTYMKLAEEGQADIFFKGKPEFLCKSSGTTGKNKTFPLNHVLCKQMLTSWSAVRYLHNTWKPKVKWGRLVFLLVYGPKRVNEHGVPYGSFSQFAMPIPDGLCTTPNLAFNNIHDEESIMYVNAVFSFNEDHVASVESIFPALAISFFSVMERRWPSIVHDIETGTLSEDLKLDPKLKQELENKLYKNPKRASFLRKEFQLGMHNILLRIWPDLSGIGVTNSGSFKSTFDYLKLKYLGDLDYYVNYHTATEGTIGFNTSGFCLETPIYTMSPLVLFYEFIPLENIEEAQPATVLMHQIKVGKLYEVVISNFNGLLRYRLGDCIQIVNLKGSLPEYKFSHRSAHCLNLICEKLDENLFQKALLQAFNMIETKILIDYTVTENVNYKMIDGETNEHFCYVLMVELENDQVKLNEEEIKLIDDELMNMHENYNLFRVRGRIQAIKVIQLKRGSFVQLKKYMMQENPHMNSTQFKLPRVIRKVEQLNFLHEKRIH